MSPQSEKSHNSGKKSPAVDPKSVTLAPDAIIQRFDGHQRIQHALMASSFILLVVSGWPLTTHGLGASQSLVGLFGGMEGCALVHRICGVVMMVAAIYHLFYLAALWRRRRLRLSMLPGPKDAQDALENIAYFVGKRPGRPKFPRYAYFEKFDYWAVFWGVAIMVGSGLLRWFPDRATSLLTPTAYEIGLHAHADEGLLAALAIFVWHFYNVHLRPQIFPMSWVFITGRMTAEELKHEHGAEYDEIVAKLRADAQTAADAEAEARAAEEAAEAAAKAAVKAPAPAAKPEEKR